MKSKVLISIGFSLSISIFAVFVAYPVGASSVSSNINYGSQKIVKVASKEKVYSYIAQSGDSYTQMVRKAIQTYGIVHNTKLSGAQIIFAETNITKQAGWPVLKESQEITIPQSTVKSWIKNAQGMVDTEKLAWNYYVQFVDFDTNSVGE